MRTLVAWLATGMLLPAVAGADPIFFDDFSGNELGPHWSRTTIEPWGYQVANGLFTVNWLPPPMSHSSTFASISTSLGAHEGDFTASAVFGWDPGQHRGLRWSVTSAFPGHLLASFTFNDAGAGPQLYIRTGSTQLMPVHTPPAGMHEFTIVRVGGTVNFSVNHLLVATLPAVERPLARTGFRFDLYPPGQTYEPVHVDWINIVPPPGTGALVLLGGALWATRRRRS